MFDSNLHIKFVARYILTFFLVLGGMSSSLHAQNKEVVAEKGDGIYTLLKRYGIPVSQNMNSFIELNKEKLGKDNILIAGKKYKLPPIPISVTSGTKTKGTGEFRTYEIFGKELILPKR